VLLLAVQALVQALPAGAAQTITVTTTGDPASPTCPSANNCSLRGAVAAAGDGDTVSVPASANAYTLTQNAQILITHSITLAGGGSAGTTVDGNASTRIFEIVTAGSPVVTMSGLTLQHGNGAGPDVNGRGGAIVNNGGATLTLSGMTLADNTSTGGFGGAILNNGTLTTQNTLLARNTAQGGGGAGRGGAIFTNGTVTMTGSALSGNTAEAPGTGGAIFSNATVTLTGDSFSGNRAEGGPAVGGFGGAVFSNAGTTVIGSMFSSNVAAAGATSGGGSGGAFFVNAALTVRDSRLTANSAAGPGSGGAILNNAGVTMSGSTLDHNQAGADTVGASASGGAIASAAASTITNSTLSANIATSAMGTPPKGGAIDVVGQSVTLTDATLSGNSAPGGEGGNVDVETGSGQSLTATNTIVADGQASTGANCNGASSGGHNVVKGVSCGFAGGGDQVADPRLGPLQDNGGPSLTMAIPFGSPAINAADANAGPATDQRGVSRPRRGGFDVGAYENRPPNVGAGANPNPAERAVPIAFSAAAVAPDAPSSVDPPGTLGFAWSFDDGATASGASVSHAFASTGVHAATVRMTEAGGATVRATVQVRVADTVAPSVASFSMTRRSFAVGPRPTATVVLTRKKRTRTGTTFRYRSSEAGIARIAVFRTTPGRRVKRRCVKPSRANRRKPRCTRLLASGALKRKARAGANQVAFTGRVGRHRLRPGKYRAKLTVTDPSGNSSAPKAITFKIVKG
jgi:hypothetical protein